MKFKIYTEYEEDICFLLHNHCTKKYDYMYQYNRNRNNRKMFINFPTTAGERVKEK